MLHPLMPFITEELWNAMGERPYELIVAKWPEPQAQVDPEAKSEIEWLISLVSEVRSARTELNVPPGEQIDCGYVERDDCRLSDRAVLLDCQTHLSRMAKVSIPAVLRERDGARSSRVRSWSTVRHFVMPLEGAIDVEAEKARLSKSATAAEKERDSLAARLANPNFTERAKPEAVEKARADHEAKAAEAERLRAALERLG